MFSTQAIIKATPSVCRTVIQSRGLTRGQQIVSAPARVKIPFAEKLVHGVLISGGLLFTPIWVLLHLKDYQGRG